ncbi:MAG: diguanylate cyclase [Campylobacterota bacterium]|nr:diguanylate cyclase [Campylobacterota bacterium]
MPNTNATVLIVDDTKSNINILLELLSDEYDVVVALDGASALDTLKEEDIDLVLLDIMMPEMDGYEVCEILKKDAALKEIPIIFITAKTDEDSIEKAYDVGGMDYVTKPFKPKELLARVRTQLHIQKLIFDLESSREELRELAEKDPMTNLYNRRYFATIADKNLQLAQRYNYELSAIMLDIDKFKNVNDTYGHSVGDDVIIMIAKKLKEFARESDVVSRFGGEEFVILFPRTSLEATLEISQKIRSMVERTLITTEEGAEFYVTISIGVSKVNNDTDNSIDDVIKRADEGLYEAKESGRNRVVVN